MASLWDLLMGSGSLTGGAPQPQSTGILPALAGSTAAPMGSGFVAGHAALSDALEAGQNAVGNGVSREQVQRDNQDDSGASIKLRA